MTTSPRRLSPPSQQRGVSIVELMIGVAIGLFILAGASLVMTTQLGDNRRLLLETQVQQDMRAVAALITRDIRRDSYWGEAYRQVWPASVAEATANVYAQQMAPRTTAGSSTLQYARSLDDEAPNAPVGTENNTVTGGELVTFSLNDSTHTIEMKLGTGSFQALTDPNVLKVTQFNFVVNAFDMPVPCGTQCPVLGIGGCPLVQSIRDVTFLIVAEAVHDARVKRSLRDTVRLRNDVNRELSPC